jgi:hypothetical protein
MWWNGAMLNPFAFCVLFMHHFETLQEPSFECRESRLQASRTSGVSMLHHPLVNHL